MKTTRRFTIGLALVSSLAFLVGVSANSSAADVDADLRAGLYMDADAFALGGGVLTGVGNSGRWFFNPNVELAFGDARDIVALNGDFHYDLRTDPGLAVWMGGGPAFIRTSRAGGSADTDIGISLLAGMGGSRGSVRPFAQVRGVVADDTGLSFVGGVRF